ncbi:hypothetical protein FCV25MIE_01473, partial [Fagus crenata]
GFEARFVTIRVQWEHERDDLIHSRDEDVQRLQEHLSRMSTTSNTPTTGVGRSTHGSSLSPNLDYRGWLGGNFGDPDL